MKMPLLLSVMRLIRPINAHLCRKPIFRQNGARASFLKPVDFYSDNNVTLKLDTSVERLDAAAKTVDLNNGETLAYKHAVIATGSRPRLLDVPGRDLQNIFNWCGMADIDAMRPHLKAAKDWWLSEAAISGWKQRRSPPI